MSSKTNTAHKSKHGNYQIVDGVYKPSKELDCPRDRSPCFLWWWDKSPSDLVKLDQFHEPINMHKSLRTAGGSNSLLTGNPQRLQNVLRRKRTDATFGANWEASFATFKIHAPQMTSRKSREYRLLISGNLE
ncbi:hypothetical protein TNCV_2516041 [Trichonephila clavipes]|nr:hypothetical protein TNCV_2516041 [Trichonephila clavipes]